MKKMTRALSGTAALAAMVTVALSTVFAAPSFASSAGDTIHTLSASPSEVMLGQVGRVPVGRCMLVDVGAPRTSPGIDRVPVKQVQPSACT